MLFFMLSFFAGEIFSQGIEKKLLIDVGPPAANGGVLSVSPDANGFYWNNMTDARPGVRVSNAKTTANINTGINLEVINRIDGTYNSSANGMNNISSTGAVGIYPSSATNDYAFAHNSTNDGRWRILGLEADQFYVIKFWGSKSEETLYRDIEIKRSDETEWKSYSAGSNTNFNNAAFFNITGKTEIDFDIRAKSTSTFGYINVIDITWNSSVSSNLAPIAIAGADLTITMPADSATLNGCSSSDPENAALKYKWTYLSGPANYSIAVDTLCSTKVRNLVVGSYAFELMVTDTGGLSHKDTVALVVNNPGPFEWPILPAPLCPESYKIVTLGSSTTYGTGASPFDSSWVNKFRKYVQIQNAQVIVTNLGLGGYTTYHVSPSDFIPPAGRPLPDPARNITAALALNPNAIIINLPTNDEASSFPIQETKDNFNRIVNAADAQNVPVWVTTSQPRNGLSVSQINNLVQLKDWVNQRFGNKAIDFWTDIANTNGTIKTIYDYGDGVHLNNLGHHILFTRSLYEKIWDTICIRRNNNNLPPVANAGPDLSITLPTDSVFLNAVASYDTDGIIIGYSWRQIEGSPTTIVNENNISTWIKSLVPGNYRFELTVTDNLLAIAKDSVLITVNPYPTITWSGAESTAWENTANWIGNVLPSATDNVFIPAGLLRYPIISVNTTIRSISCSEGTSAAIAAGILLTLTGK